MKRLIFCAVTIVFISACRYEEGPEFTVRTAKHRVVNTWYMNRIFIGGNDRTSDFEDYKMHIYKDQTYVISYQQGSGPDYKETGKWSFTSAKLNIKLMPDVSVNDSTSSWRITLLTERAMTLTRNIDGLYTELQLED